MPGFEVYPTADRDLLSDPGPDILTESFFRSSGAYIMEGRVFRIAAPDIWKRGARGQDIEKFRGSGKGTGTELNQRKERDETRLSTSEYLLSPTMEKPSGFFGKSVFQKSFNHALLNIFLFPYLLLSFIPRPRYVTGDP